MAYVVERKFGTNCLRMTLGLVIGKFYPPHKGHKFLIDTARTQCDRLIVILCHHASQTIPGEVRKVWLEEIHPDCDIHLVPDELPNESAPWAAFTLAYLGRAPDMVFTSEIYGDTYAALMGTRHHLVDLARNTVPISASRIWTDPLLHLDWMEPCVRAWFVRRVVILGAESTGKTTLADNLARSFQTQWVPEYGREQWEGKVRAHKVGDPPLSWSADDFIAIAIEQQRRENLAARIANKLLICDTNAFATGTWYERYFNSRHPQVDAIGANDRAHLYLLPASDVPFVQDGFRDGEKIRDWMHARFLTQLKAQTVPFEVIDGPHAQRHAKALDAIARHLGVTPQSNASPDASD